MVEWDWEKAFVVCAAVVVSAAVLWGLCHAVVERRLICKTILDFIKGLSTCRSKKKQAEVKYLDEQVALEKKNLAQKVFFVYLCLAVFNLAHILYNVFMERPRWMSTGGSWVLAIGTIVLLLAHVPSMLSVRNVDFWAALLQLFVMAFTSPLATSVDEAFISAVGLFMVVCIPAAACTTRSSVLLFCQVLFFFSSIVRVVIDDEEFELASQCSQLNNPNTYVVCHLCFVPMAFCVSHWAHQLIKNRIIARFREAKSNTQLSAATALLDLTCDAVVALNGDLRMASHSSKLAAVLLRNRPGATLEGTKFTDLVAPADCERVTELLRRDSGGRTYATAFRMQLVDSCASKFQTEVFQVKYTTAGGEKHHIIGLRDCTDLQPLAVEHEASSADQSTVTVRRSNSASRPLSELSEVQVTNSVSEDFLPAMIVRQSVSPRSPGSSGSRSSSYGNERVDRLSDRVDRMDRVDRVDRAERPEQSERRERSVKIKQKDAFLEIDPEEELVKCATAPFSDLAGQKLSEISFSNFALQTCHRLCRDAKAFNSSFSTQGTEVKFPLPDQIATFDNMPLLTAPRLVEATGLMKVCCTDLGSLRVVICVRQRRISSNVANSPETSPRGSRSEWSCSL